MSVDDRLASLRSQIEAAEAEQHLLGELTAAKQAYASNPSEDTRAAKQAAMEAIRKHRSETRPEGVTVGGDAYVDKEV